MNASLSKFFPILFIPFIIQHCVAQERTEHYELSGSKKLVNTTFIRDKGIILVTGNPETFGNVNYTMRFIDAHGKEKWSSEILVVHPAQAKRTEVLVSPDNETIYFVELRAVPFDNKKPIDKKAYVTKISLAGKMDRFEFDQASLGTTAQTIFCDNKYLYFLGSVHGDETHKNKKTEENLVLNRFNRDGFSQKTIILDLPKIESGDENIFWSFIGQRENEKFLVSKKLGSDDRDFTYRIISFDSDGLVTKPISIQTSIPVDMHARPLFPVFNSSVSQLISPDRIWGSSKYGAILLPGKGAFGQVVYDDLQNCFFAYSTFGSNQFRQSFPHFAKFDGFVITKFDRAGSKLWTFSPALSEAEAPKKVAIIANEKGIVLNVEVSDYKLSGTAFASYVVDLAGNGSKLESTDAHYGFEYIQSSPRKSLAWSYIKNTEAPRTTQYKCFQHASTEVLLAYREGKGEIDVLSFGK